MAEGADSTRAAIRAFVDFVFMQMEVGNHDIAHAHEALLIGMYGLADRKEELETLTQGVKDKIALDSVER